MRCNSCRKSITLLPIRLPTGQVVGKPTIRKLHIFTLLFVYALFLSISFAQDVTQWRVSEGGQALPNSTSINTLIFSPDGSQLAVADTNGTALYDTDTGEVLTLFPALLADVTVLAFSPDNQTVASASEDATVRLWDARTGEHRTDLIGHTDPVVNFSILTR